MEDKTMSETRLATFIVGGVLGVFSIIFGTITYYNYLQFRVQTEVIKAIASYWPTALENSIRHVTDCFTQVFGG